MAHKLKTEHAGAKNGGGARTYRAIAKAESKVRRRINDKALIKKEEQEILEEEPRFCPACGGETYELGRLGMRIHYRCRACGIDSSLDSINE